MPRTATLIEDLEARREVQRLEGALLADDIHDMVGQSIEKPLRNKLLKVRRDIHNGRANESTRAAINAIADQIPELAQRVRDWLDRAAEIAEVDLALAARSGLELDAIRDDVVAALGTDRLAEGLAIASPDFAEALARVRRAPDGAPGKWDRFLRTAVSYLTRATLKPSPFSYLTTVGPIVLEGESATEPIDTGGDQLVSSRRSLAMFLLRAWICDDPTSDGAELRLNPSLRKINGREFAALPFYTRGKGVEYRVDELTDVTPVVPRLRMRPGQVVRLVDIARRARLTTAAVRRFVDSGVLCPVVPWRLDADLHFGALHDEIARVSRGTSALLEPLATLAQLESDILNGGPDTIAALGAGKDAAEAAIRQHGAHGASALGSGALVHTIGAHHTQLSAPLPSWAIDEVNSLANSVRGRLAVHPDYVELVRAFDYLYGETARPVDLLSFLFEAQQLQVRMAESAGVGRGRQIRASDITFDREPLWMSSVFFQVATDADGDRQVVINGIQEGMIGLIGRWANVPNARAAADVDLAAWLDARSAGARLYQFSAFSDWVSFQRPAVRAVPIVGFGPELACRGTQAHDLAGFSIRRATGGGLEVLDPFGERAELVYLGAIPPRLLTGVEKQLFGLSMPKRLTGKPAWADELVADSIGHTPRITRGKIVVARESWMVKADDLPQVAPSASLAETHRQVSDWARQRGIPEEFFSRVAGCEPGSMRPEKPHWISLGHPPTVQYWLSSLAGRSDDVEITEALPSAAHADRRHHVTEFSILVGTNEGNP